jgi:hypothetical protein
MSRSRAPLAIGLAAAGGVGYYLYSAGGNPRAAEKQFESEHTTQTTPTYFSPIIVTYNNTTGDAHHIAAKIKGETPHRTTDAEQQGRKVGQELGAKVDNAVRPSRAVSNQLLPRQFH